MAEPIKLAGRYRLVRRLSRTEMAEVYEAVDETLERRVAAKVLLPELADDPDFVARFQREARAAAILNHPNIVSVYDSGRHDGSYFIVMEFVDGPTLAELIADEAPLHEARAAEIGVQIAAALAAAHQAGIVHRDVKPGNVLLDGGGTVKVVDFGIARAAAHTDLTRPGTIVGSASYLSPEQARGGETGPASDLYSLGAVLFAMVTGRPPFVADSPIAVAHQHVHEPPISPRQLNADISPAFEALVLRALAKDPADRPGSAEAMRQELLDVVEGATAPDAMSPDATTVMDATRSSPVHSETRVLSGVPPAAAARLDANRNRRAAVTAIVAVILAVAVIALIAAIANQVRNNSTTSTTVPPTVATTIPVRGPVVTRPAVTTTPPTTEAPTTTTEAPTTVSIDLFPTTTP
jgi:eukaryotic-like serine/threonine-protein kinase